MSKPEEKETHQEKVLKLLEKQIEVTEGQSNKINDLISHYQKQQTTSTPTTSDSKPAEHQTVEEIANCPNCRGHYKVDEYDAKLKKEWTKKERENVKLFPDVCDPSKGGCGLGVDHQKEESCPNCGSKEARKR